MHDDVSQIHVSTYLLLIKLSLFRSISYLSTFVVSNFQDTAHVRCIEGTKAAVSKPSGPADNRVYDA